MIQTINLLILVQLIVVSNTLHPSLNEENKLVLNHQKCDSNGDWTPVKYEDIEISAIHQSLSGLRANNESCANFPILLESGSTLELGVYLKTVDVNSGIVIVVYLNEKELIAERILTRNYGGGEDGWREISLQIEKNGPGYIDLLGYSRDSEIVLIDSILYKYDTTIDDISDKGPIDNKEKKYIDIKKLVHSDYGSRNDMNSYHAPSSVKEPKTEDSKLEDLKSSRGNDSAGLGPWAITLISLGCVTVAALVTVSAYYIGKMIGAPKVSPIDPIVIDQEPPRVEIIPRVRGTVDYFEDTVQNYL